MSQMQFTWETGLDSANVPVYMGRAYQNLLADYDHTEARTLTCTAGGQTSHLPMLVRDLGNGQKEAYSAYGYGGLLGELSLSNSDVQALKAFLAETSILALFLRHTPFITNQNAWPSDLSTLSRRTYATSLQPHEHFDNYLAGLPQKLRWSVNHAQRAGLQVSFHDLSMCLDSKIQAFYSLYAGLMQQKSTANYYLFSEAFFFEHARYLGARCELAEIVNNETGELMAGAFFLTDGTGWAHYHLSAATRELMKQQGMELLISSAIFRYGNDGYRALHLGGGHALDESDGLSRFKAKFASNRFDFCCTKLVCDEVGYLMERERLPLAHPDFFLITDARAF